MSSTKPKSKISKRTVSKKPNNSLVSDQYLYNRIIENAGEGIVVFDTELKYVLWNPFMEQLTGLREEEVIGKISTDIFPYLKEQHIDKHLKQALKGKRVKSHETKFEIPQTGKSGWTECTYEPLLNSEGIQVGVIGIIVDITQEKETQDRLEKINRQHRWILETSEKLLTRRNLDEVMQEILTDLQQVIHFDIGGFHWHDKENNVFSPGLIVHTKIHLKEFSISGFSTEKGISGYVLRTGEGVLVNNAHKDSRSYYPDNMEINKEHLICVPIRIKRTTIGIVNIGRFSDPPFSKEDFEFITLFINHTSLPIENARLFEETKTSEELLRSIVEGTHALIFKTNTKGQFTYVNEAGAKILGIPHKQLLGRFYLKFVHPDDRKRVHSYYSSQLKSGSPHSFIEFRYSVDNGNTGWLSFHVSPQFENRTLTGLAGIAQEISARKNLEEEHSIQRQFLYQILDLNPSLIYAKDLNGKITLVNQAVADLRGYSTKEMVGKTESALATNENEVEFFRNSDRSVFESGKDLYIPEEKIIDKTGTVRWLQTTKRPIKSPDGSVVQVMGVSTDITDRKKMELALRESEQKYKDIFRWAPVGIYQTNREGIIINANESFAKILGYDTASEVIGTNIAETTYFRKTDRENLISLFEPRGSVADIEVLWKKKDSTPIWIALTSHTIKNKENEISYFEGFIHDITSRKHDQDSIKQSEEQFRSLVENAHDIIFTTDMKGNIISLNPIFEILTGFSREEWVRKSFFTLLHADDLFVAEESFQKTLEGGIPDPYEIRLQIKDGQYLSFELTTTPRRTNSIITGILGIARDISQRKELEEHLRQAQKLESIGTLAGGIAHDFNNILSIIMGYTQLMERGKSDPSLITSSSDAIIKTVKRGANLVRQILTFARKTEITLEPVNVNSVIEDIVKMLRETFPKTISFKLSLDESIPMLTMDHTQLHQALLNLSINARDALLDSAMPVLSSLEISYKTSIVAAETLTEYHQHLLTGMYLRITVADTGIGIDAKTKSRIFEPFFTTKELGKGTGLGLAVVYGIVESHHGFINVESQPGEGTSFELYFPMPELTSIADEPAGEQSMEFCKGTETIFVVEDELLLQDLVKTILTSSGYTVITANDGEEAIEQFSKHRSEIDLVITDLGLPKMTGKEVLILMKAMSPNTPVIIASGYIERNVKSELLESGAYDVMHKPYLPNELLSKIRQVFDGNKGF